MFTAIYFTREEKNKINDGKFTSDFRTYPFCIFGFSTYNSNKMLHWWKDKRSKKTVLTIGG